MEKRSIIELAVLIILIQSMCTVNAQDIDIEDVRAATTPDPGDKDLASDFVSDLTSDIDDKLKDEKFAGVQISAITWNPVIYCLPGDPNCRVTEGVDEIMTMFIQLTIPFYVIALMFTALFFIFKSGSPRSRGRARSMFLKLIYGMIFVVTSPLIYQALLDLELIGVDWLLYNHVRTIDVWLFELSLPSNPMPTVADNINLIRHPIMYTHSTISYCFFQLVYLMALIFASIIAWLRNIMVFVYGVFFPIIIFFYSFDPTKPWGRRWLNDALKWVFVPLIQALILVFTISLTRSFITTVSFLNPLRNTMIFFTICSGYALFAMAPLIIGQVLGWIGNAIVAMGLGAGRTWMIAWGGIIAGQGPSAIAYAHSEFSRQRAYETSRQAQMGAGAMGYVASPRGPTGFMGYDGSVGMIGGGDSEGPTSVVRGPGAPGRSGTYGMSGDYYEGPGGVVGYESLGRGERGVRDRESARRGEGGVDEERGPGGRGTGRERYAGGRGTGRERYAGGRGTGRERYAGGRGGADVVTEEGDVTGVGSGTAVGVTGEATSKSGEPGGMTQDELINKYGGYRRGAIGESMRARRLKGAEGFHVSGTGEGEEERKAPPMPIDEDYVTAIKKEAEEGMKGGVDIYSEIKKAVRQEGFGTGVGRSMEDSGVKLPAYGEDVETGAAPLGDSLASAGMKGPPVSVKAEPQPAGVSKESEIQARVGAEETERDSRASAEQQALRAMGEKDDQALKMEGPTVIKPEVRKPEAEEMERRIQAQVAAEEQDRERRTAAEETARREGAEREERERSRRAEEEFEALKESGDREAEADRRKEEGKAEKKRKSKRK
jgi:hypothetical protein